jgi:hypothetical protein
MLNFFARSGRKIEKIDSLWTGRGIWKMDTETEPRNQKLCG